MPIKPSAELTYSLPWIERMLFTVEAICQWLSWVTQSRVKINGGSLHALQWLHNEHDGVSNHQRLDCLLNRLFRPRSKKTSKLRVTGLCEAISRCGWWKLAAKYCDMCLNTMRNKSRSIFIFGWPSHEIGADMVDRQWPPKLLAYRPWLSITKWCSVSCWSDLIRRSNASRDWWESAIGATLYLNRECRPW